jgi:hypothetical protein
MIFALRAPLKKKYFLRRRTYSLPVEPKCTKINRTQAALLRPTRPNRLKQPCLQNVNTLFLSLKLCDSGILRPFAAPANYKV